ncbi:MAG: NAD(P)/FAD-dependent oxidoreductase [Alphaproteobacteria bacterium]
MEAIQTTDVAIIGAGPVGLFTIFQCGMMRLKCHVIDPLDMPGGQCAALYPEKPIYDIPAFPKICGQELIDQLLQQVAPFDPIFHLGQQAISLSQEAEGDGFLIKTSRNTCLKAKAVVIAAGAGAFGPNRPPLESIEAFEGTSVFYHVHRPEAFAGKRVVIAGGGDSAVDWALHLAEKGADVTVVHRRAKFRANPDNEAKLKTWAVEGRLKLSIPFQLYGLEGDVVHGLLQAIQVQSLSGEVVRLPADILLPFFGLSMELGPLSTWGMAFENNRIMVNPATFETSIPGVYGVGDIVTYPHKLKLILTGFAEAAQAAHAIRSRLFPDQHFHFEYSTTSGVAPLV